MDFARIIKCKKSCTQQQQKSVKRIIHIKTNPVKISIGNCRYGAGFKLIQQNGRLFSQEGYEFRDNVTETAVDGGANLIFQNDSYIKMSKATVDDDANLTNHPGGGWNIIHPKHVRGWGLL